MFDLRRSRLTVLDALWAGPLLAIAGCGDTTPTPSATTDVTSSASTSNTSVPTTIAPQPPPPPTSTQATTSSNTTSSSSTSSDPESSFTGGESSAPASASDTVASGSEVTSAAATSERASGSGADETSAPSTTETPALLPGEFAGTMDGLLYKGECATSAAADECSPAGCVNNVFEQKSNVTLGGDSNVVYEVELHVYGVVELRKGYTGGTRRQGGTGNAQSTKDFWYEGGSFEPGNYNVYSLRVTPAVPGVPDANDNGNNYFLNARDDSNEGHEVWELNYTATILAQGGSQLEFRAYDQNCTQIQNVGSAARPSQGSGPGGAMVVDLDMANPAPANFDQPLSTNGDNGQWIYVDVLSVAPKP